MTSFETFGLAPPILRALTEEGYSTPTPIQAQCIAEVMSGRDLQGIAQTGTGKTAAFALPILHRLAQDRRNAPPRACRALVLSPTRELATQIADSFRAYGRHLRMSVEVIFGGVPAGRQQRALARGVDVLVATPGRLLDLSDGRHLDLRHVETLVLDEADQMLDLGFIHALKRIAGLVPKRRQTLFFSATMPNAIEALSAQFITDPVKVAVAPAATTAERVDQGVIFVSTANKAPLLRAVLQDLPIDRALVFTRTKHGADRVVTQLGRSGIVASAIHGNKSQGQRERALGDFRSGRCRILVATDIAARGIDVEGVSHVINFDLPNVAESYVHRIGRTARAGATGQAISFCNDEERAYLRDIEKLTRMRVPVLPAPASFAAGVLPEAAPLAELPGGKRPGEAGRPGSRPGGRGQSGRPNRGPDSGNRGGEGARGDRRPASGNGAGRDRSGSGPARPGPTRSGSGAARPAVARPSGRSPAHGPDGRDIPWLDRRPSGPDR